MRRSHFFNKMICPENWLQANKNKHKTKTVSKHRPNRAERQGTKSLETKRVKRLTKKIAVVSPFKRPRSKNT